MKALITGASSGIGRDMARILSEQGYDLILVARRKNRLEALKEELKTDVEIISMDLSSTFNCMKLYNKVKDKNIDLLINNAGFGLFGEFADTPLDKELDMIDTNVKALHTLTKVFLQDFIEKDKGSILNVSSAAAFSAGPLMATYYGTKAYVLHLTEAINEELRRNKSKVYVGAFCPGPVNTEFNKVAEVNFAIKGISSYDAAKAAIKGIKKRKTIIVPSVKIKLATIGARLFPRKLVTRISYNIKNGKNKK